MSTKSSLRLVDQKTDQQAFVDFLNATSTVSRYAYSIIQTDLPVLRDPFPTYADYVVKFGEARTNALVWIQSVIPSFDAVPNALLTLNALFQEQLSTLTDDLKALKQRPHDSDLHRRVETDFQELLESCRNASAAVESVETSILDYAKTMEKDGKTLAELAQAARDAESVDQKDIDKLNGVINEINSTIDTINERLTLEKFGQWDKALLLVAAGFTVGVITGGAGSVLFGVATATAGVFIPIGGSVIDPDEIERLQGEMTAVNEEIGALATDVGILQTTAAQFNAIASKTSGVLDVLKTIKTYWGSLEALSQTVTDDLDAALKTWTSTDQVDATIQDLEQARRDWNEVEAFAHQLVSVDYTFDPDVKMASNGHFLAA